MNVKEQYWKYSLVTIIVVLGTILFVEFIPFLGGILGACTIYILVRKQMLYLTEKKHLRRSFVAVILLLETILCFLIPLSLAVWLFINKLQNFNLDPTQLVKSAEHIANLIEQRTGYDVLDTSNIMSAVSILPKIGQVLMGGISGFAINVAVLVLILYFMLSFLLFCKHRDLFFPRTDYYSNKAPARNLLFTYLLQLCLLPMITFILSKQPCFPCPCG